MAWYWQVLIVVLVLLGLLVCGWVYCAGQLGKRKPEVAMPEEAAELDDRVTWELTLTDGLGDA